MASLRQIRGRLKSIQNSKQIMWAMQLVSGSKLKRSQDRLLQARAVLGFLDGMLGRVLASTALGGASPERSRGTAAASPDHPLCRASEGPSTLVVFTSDAGLCGSYNSNLIHLAEAHLRRDSARGTQLVFIGKRGWRYFTKRGWTAAEAYVDLAGRPNPAKAEQIGRALLERFLAGQIASISLLYAQFVSAAVSRPAVVPWLPIKLGQGAGDQGPGATSSLAPRPSPLRGDEEYIFEPSAERVFEALLPRWALARFSLALLEAFTSEHSARMIAMKNATDNAQDLLNSLTRQRNKIRQASITKELSEIVGTAEALK